MTSIFEPIFVFSELEGDIVQLLRDWNGVYLKEIRIQLGQPTTVVYPKLRFIGVDNNFDSFPEEQLPMAIVISTGLADEPVKDGEGIYGGWVGVGVGVVASGRDEATSSHLVNVYASCVRSILLQHQAIVPGKFGGVEYIDEQKEPIYDDSADRTLHAVQLIFRVYVENLVNIYGGPGYELPDEDDQPGSEWPTADTVIVTTNIVGREEDPSG